MVKLEMLEIFVIASVHLVNYLKILNSLQLIKRYSIPMLCPKNLNGNALMLVFLFLYLFLCLFYTIFFYLGSMLSIDTTLHHIAIVNLYIPSMIAFMQCIPFVFHRYFIKALHIYSYVFEYIYEAFMYTVQCTMYSVHCTVYIVNNAYTKPTL